MCVCVCMCVIACVRIGFIGDCVQVSMHTYLYISVCGCACMRVYLCIFMHACVCMYVHACVCMYVRMYAYAHTFNDVHILSLPKKCLQAVLLRSFFPEPGRSSILPLSCSGVDINLYKDY